MPARGPIYEKTFDEDRESIESDFHRFDDAFRYAEKTLCDEPTRGRESQTKGIWRARLRLPGDGRVIRISVFYAFDDENVRFISIRKHP